MAYFKDLEIAVIDAFEDGYHADEIAAQFNVSLEDVNAMIEEYKEYTGQGIDADPGDMDGDFDSAMASAGFGTDEDYGYYGDE
jgi:hypothetical protein